MASNEGETTSPTAVAAQESQSSVLRTSCILDSILECLQPTRPLHFIPSNPKALIVCPLPLHPSRPSQKPLKSHVSEPCLTLWEQQPGPTIQMLHISHLGCTFKRRIASWDFSWAQCPTVRWPLHPPIRAHHTCSTHFLRDYRGSVFPMYGRVALPCQYHWEGYQMGTCSPHRGPILVHDSTHLD